MGIILLTITRIVFIYGSIQESKDVIDLPLIWGSGVAKLILFILTLLLAIITAIILILSFGVLKSLGVFLIHSFIFTAFGLDGVITKLIIKLGL